MYATMRTIDIVKDEFGRPTNNGVIIDQEPYGPRRMKMVIWTPEGATIIDSDGGQTRVAKDGTKID